MLNNFKILICNSNYFLRSFNFSIKFKNEILFGKKIKALLNALLQGVYFFLYVSRTLLENSKNLVKLFVFFK
jgi:hypothetical protein